MNSSKSAASSIEDIQKLVKSDGERIDSAIIFWDETEAIVKRAEHINHDMIIPAVSELRYAGRKLVDYLSALRCELDSQTINSHLDDFTQCCIRARHDAIDALVSYVVEYLENLEDEVGANIVESFLPDYKAYKVCLRESVNLIISSRKERKNRNNLYSEINSNYVDKIVESFDEIEIKRTFMFAKREELDRRQNIASWAFSVTFGALTVVASVLAIMILKPL